MDIQEYFKGLISDQQFSEALNQQHYTFAHKVIPYIVENHFPELVTKVGNESAQSWISQVWNECMECDDLRLFQEWVLQWQDLGEFEIIPVVPSKETAEVVSKML